MTRIGYVVKVYPRFSETFIVTEILAREAHGDDLSIYALRPTTDTRFHPAIARVRARVEWISRPRNAQALWEQMTGCLTDNGMRSRMARLLPTLASLPADDVAAGLDLAARARRDGITHLHAHFATLAARSTWIASQLTGIPYTVTTHAKDIFHEDVDMVWLQRICADADRVLAISRFNEQYLQRILAGTGARICLRYNAIELDRFPFRDPHVPEPSQRLRVAAVGRLVEKKGFSDLIKALAELTGDGIDASAVIAGDGQLRQELLDQVRTLGLDQRVSLPGALTQSEVISLLRQAHVLVVPCIPGSDGNVDGLPTVVLEAMASGTPVFATDVTGMHEVVRHERTGILLPPGRPTLLAQSLRDLANGGIDPLPLARCARALVEREFDSREQAAELSAWQRHSEEEN